MSVPLWILGVMALIAAVAFYAQWRRQGEATRRLERQMADEREQAHEALRESSARVKRIERESSREIDRAEHRLLYDLLPLVDALDAAGASDASDDSADAIRDGLAMVRKQLETMLEKHEIQRIAPAPGDAFDPAVHEAVEMRETDEIREGAVAACHRAGFVQGDDLLRAAMVAVAAVTEVQNHEIVDEPIAADAETGAEDTPNHELTDPAIESNLTASQPIEQK